MLLKFILGPIFLGSTFKSLDKIGSIEFIPSPNVVNKMNKGILSDINAKNPDIPITMEISIDDIFTFLISGKNAYAKKDSE